jgi:DNA repair exonuclease SbcCD ATPase subunit
MELLAQAENIIQQLDYYQREVTYKTSKILDCDANITVLSHKKELISQAKEYHKKAIDILYRTSIQELEELINDVVGSVFYDRNLRVKMELTDSRSKSLVWYVLDEDTGIQMSVKNGVGRGVRTVLSFIIQSYYLLSLGSKFMFVDEGYSYISEAYVGKFFEFVNLLCKEKGLSLIMISHDTRFMEYADSFYYVSGGTLSKDQDALQQLIQSDLSEKEEVNGNKD